MKQVLYGLLLAVGISYVCIDASAQQANQVSEEALPSAPSTLISPVGNTASDAFTHVESSAVSSSQSRASMITPIRLPLRQRVADRNFLLLNGLYLGMAIFDVEMTQSCIASKHCVEKNPLMPSSHAGQIGLNLALVGGGSMISYFQKKRGSKTWWVAPIVGSAIHGFGVSTGFRHQ